MIHKSDILVIGGGIAGMSYALRVANSGKGKVVLVCKTTLDEANTTKAQGGIASVTNLSIDNFEKHITDTMVAGDFISDPQAVEMQYYRHAHGIAATLAKYSDFTDAAVGGAGPCQYELQPSIMAENNT